MGRCGFVLFRGQEMATVSQLAPSVLVSIRHFIFMKTRTPPSPVAPDESLCPSPEPTVSFFQDPLCLTNIVVPLDLSLESLRALDFAFPLGQRFGARLHLVHVFEGAHQFATVATSPLLWSEAEAKRHLADEVELIFGARPRGEDCHLRVGPAPREIVAAARELRADLIVIATHGRSGWRHLALGSTTEKVIRSANCPVLVVREKMPGPVRRTNQGIVLQKILVPVDFSECALDGARYASVFATAVGADLLLLHVVRPRPHQIEESRGPAQHWSQELKDAVLDAEDQLDTLVNGLPLLGIKAETEVEVGVPAEKLAMESRRAAVDLIITSTHGYSGLRHALLGSIAEELAREAGCPVLIVPSHLRKG
jgi:nucleotide-binding universal stress UspA family protein